MELGILDFSRIYPASNDPVDAIWSTIELAQLADRLGYSRYWLGEHHTADVAHSAPEILLPVVAGVTERIRVGVAGVLLNYQSPLRVAKTFRLLNTLFPDRIDLGVARGRVEPDVMELLTHQEASDIERTYGKKVEQLLQFLAGRSPVCVNPATVAAPEVWLLGTRTDSASLAAANGVPFCLSMFFGTSREERLASVSRYRDELGNGLGNGPRVAGALAGVCAPTHDEALRIARQWHRGLLPTVIGTPTECREMLDEAIETYGFEHVVFLDASPSHAARQRSMELIAEACDLERNEKSNALASCTIRA